MTSATKSGDDRSATGSAASTLLGAASVASRGPAGVGLLLAKKGYGLARQRTAQRRVKTAERLTGSRLAASVASTPTTSSRSSRSKVPRRVLAVAGVVALAGGAIVYLGRRRNEVPPPADVPPRLEDYTASVS